MVDDPNEKVVNASIETLTEAVDTKEASPEKVSGKMATRWQVQW